MSDAQGDGVEQDSGGKSGHGRSEQAARPATKPKDELLTAKKPDIWAATQKSSFSLETTGDKKAEPVKSKSEEPAPKSASVIAKKDVLSEPKKASAPPEKKPEAKQPAKDKKDKADSKAEASKAATTAKSKNPERYWVQIATGAYKPDLGKAWGKLKEKYPALLARRSAWTTPMNRTNRLLIGPFKTDDEAQSFVNKAAGGDFMTSRFTSPAGQLVEPIK
jgi:cell division septation protein DedD